MKALSQNVRTAVEGIDHTVSTAMHTEGATIITRANSEEVILPFKAEIPTLLFACLSNLAYRGLRDG